MSSTAARQDGAAPSLTLGALYRMLRAGVGDSGAALVSIRFEQRASQGTIGGADSVSSAVLTRSSLRAELEFVESQLHRADMMASGSSIAGNLRVSFVANSGGYLYSLDGTNFGRYVGPVVLFDVSSFEDLLSFVKVRDVTIDERADPAGMPLDVLEVDLDTEAFNRLLRVFGSDADSRDAEIQLDDYSVNLSVGGELVVEYGWQLLGVQRAGTSAAPTTINCHVTIKLMPITVAPTALLAIDPDLPLLRRVDDVWTLARSHSQVGQDDG